MQAHYVVITSSEPKNSKTQTRCVMKKSSSTKTPKKSFFKGRLVYRKWTSLKWPFVVIYLSVNYSHIEMNHIIWKSRIIISQNSLIFRRISSLKWVILFGCPSSSLLTLGLFLNLQRDLIINHDLNNLIFFLQTELTTLGRLISRLFHHFLSKYLNKISFSKKIN